MDDDSNTCQLGDELQGTIVAPISPIDSGRWHVTSPELPYGWTAVLRSRSDRLYEPGDVDRFWIYHVTPSRQVAFLSDADYGRLPITDRMRPRYVAALRSALRLISHPHAVTAAVPDHLSELKGMFNRCAKEDQWDWLTVYDALGRPPISMLRKAAAQFGELARALRHEDVEKAGQHLALILSLNLEPTLNHALAHITEAMPRLGESTLLRFRPMQDRSRAVTQAQEVASGEYILSQVSRSKLDWANATHERTLQLLVTHLESRGFVVEYNQLVDAYSRLKRGPAIFEVKSITPENEREQCRHALSQLMEYRYLHDVPDASLWLVLSHPLKLDWLVDYLETNRHIAVIWVEGDSLAGPSFRRLLENTC